jgi:hypothetical protein
MDSIADLVIQKLANQRHRENAKRALGFQLSTDEREIVNELELYDLLYLISEAQLNQQGLA